MRQAEIAILQYILAYKDARDTVRGIEKWWLPQSRPYSVADVETALQNLVELNLIQMWEPAAAEPVYGRAAEDSHPIEEYLRHYEQQPAAAEVSSEYPSTTLQSPASSQHQSATEAAGPCHRSNH